MEYYYLILYICFGLLPSLFWLLYYLRKDLHPEPKKIILKVYFYGILITIPVFCLQIWLAGLLGNLQSSGIFSQYPIVIDILKWFFVIALTEEVLKYIGLRFAVLKNGVLDEPLDVMLYMVIVATGFAGLENILYLFPSNGLPFDIAIKNALTISTIRFVGATLLHTLCSAVLGYFLALSFLRTKQKTLLTITGIVLATTLHGLFNFSIITLESPANMIVPSIIIIGLTIFVMHAFSELKKLKSICKV